MIFGGKGSRRLHGFVQLDSVSDTMHRSLMRSIIFVSSSFHCIPPPHARHQIPPGLSPPTSTCGSSRLFRGHNVTFGTHNRLRSVVDETPGVAFLSAGRMPMHDHNLRSKVRAITGRASISPRLKQFQILRWVDACSGQVHVQPALRAWCHVIGLGATITRRPWRTCSLDP